MKIRGTVLLHYAMDARRELDDAAVRQAVVDAVGHNATFVPEYSVSIEKADLENVTIERGDA